MMDFKKNLIRNWRIWLLVLMVLISLALITTKGISFGIDFMGGTELKMQLEQGGTDYIEPTTRILKERLNGLGLKSIQVLPEADRKHITIKVSSTTPAELERVKNILNRQAIFEQYVEGELCARGDEIQLDVSYQGGSTIIDRNWQVYVKTIGDAPARCGLAMKGMAGHMTDVFLDRPRNSIILLDNEVCNELASNDFSNNENDVGYTQLTFIEDRANVPVVCYLSGGETEDEGTIDEELGIIFEGNQSNTTTGNQTVGEVSNENAAKEIRELWETGNKTRIILMVNKTLLPEDLQDLLDELNLTVTLIPKSSEQPYHSRDDPDSWMDKVTGLKSTLEIQEGLTYGQPIFSSVFTGTASSEKEAKEIVRSYEIWLTSGNLPTKITIVLEKPSLPELGQQFFYSSALVALIAIILVALIVTLRYREPRISMFILAVGFSEIVIIIGFASLVSWELDLAAVAGIIAAVGTGVDAQIIITDETLRGERRKEEKKLWDIKSSIGRAFFIIFTSGFTMIGAMLPLMSIVDLRGFAFTTIIGVGIGILVTRPAYARIAELVV